MTPTEALSAIVDAAKPAELPSLAGELARALGAVLAKAAAAPMRPSLATGDTPTEAPLTVEQAAARLGVRPSWLYRHWRNLPFARKVGHRTLRFDARGLDRWLANRGHR